MIPKRKIKYTTNDKGCWLVDGYNENGYPRTWIPSINRNVLIHVYLYQQKYGDVPNELDLGHKCRNRNCVNPGHLEPVTRAINVRRGKNTKLTNIQVQEIRELLNSNVSQAEIGRKYGVTRHTIYDIKHNRSWRDMKEIKL